MRTSRSSPKPPIFAWSPNSGSGLNNLQATRRRWAALGWARDVRIEARGFVLDVIVNERLPLVVQGHAAEVQQGLGAGKSPISDLARSIRSLTT